MKVGHIRKALDEERQALLEHSLYAKMKDIQSLRIFMEHHVWSVYDFMCLAKRLQCAFTSIAFPWSPPRQPGIARLMNEIILGIETDVRPDGTAASHFDLYLDAIEEVGAHIAPVQRYLQALEAGRTWQGSLQNSGAPAAAAAFIRQTLESIENQNLAFVAGAFTFGREMLIPDLFIQFLDAVKESHPGRTAGLAYYLERHAEVDRKGHSPLALEMLEKTIELGHGTAEDVLEGAQTELVKRIRLWDAVLYTMEVSIDAATAS